MLVHKYRRASWLVQHKESACNAGDAGQEGSTPELGRFPGGGNGNPLQCSCLESPMDRGDLEGYDPWGHREVRHNLLTKQQQQENLASC